MSQVEKYGWPAALGLKAGDWVVIRSEEEILATLDEQARLDRLPFQPEMLAFCGRRLLVSKVAHKTCDNIHKTGGRRMLNAVHLEAARCDGAAHGHCMADCAFIWKEAWLKRDDDLSNHPTPVVVASCDVERVKARAHAPGQENESDPIYVCQTTALYEATTLLPWWDVRQYVRDVTTGNHSAWHITKLLVFSWYRALFRFGVGYRALVQLFDAFQRLHGGKPFPAGAGQIQDGQPTPTELLHLKPGEWVEIRPTAEILSTITTSGFNRGMGYDIMEMSKYSGERHRVQMRVDRLISEQTGKMIQMKSPCIQLENVYCRAECTPKRLGCPRASNTYWREIWLRRVAAPDEKL